ncbi:hypothetical protein FKM82_008826 [Ascaphus truei]
MQCPFKRFVHLFTPGQLTYAAIIPTSDAFKCFLPSPLTIIASVTVLCKVRYSQVYRGLDTNFRQQSLFSKDWLSPENVHSYLI